MADLSPVEIVVHQACKTGDITQMTNMFRKIMNSKDDQGKTPLEHAVNKGDPRMVGYIVIMGADVNVKSEDGQTPLHYAVEKGHTRVAKCLLGDGAGVDTKDNNGCTPLYIASQSGHLEIVKVLIQYKAQINQKKVANEWTPLQPVNYLEAKIYKVKSKLLVLYTSSVFEQDSEVRDFLNTNQCE